MNPPKELRFFFAFIALIVLIWTYVAVEPFIYAFCGFGFVWDYNLDFIPLIYR